MKTCTRCGVTKDEDEFQIRQMSTDGLTASCKSCLKIYDAKRAMLPHRVKARALYAKTDAGAKACTRAKRKWQESNIVKRAASILLGNYVRDGKIVKSYKCEQCGIDGVRIHGHHDDYSKPLAVRWLCSKCHRSWHKENGEGANTKG